MSGHQQLYLGQDDQQLDKQLHEQRQLRQDSLWPVPGQGPLVLLHEDLVGGEGESQQLQDHGHDPRQHRQVARQLGEDSRNKEYFSNYINFYQKNLSYCIFYLEN